MVQNNEIFGIVIGRNGRVHVLSEKTLQMYTCVFSRLEHVLLAHVRPVFLGGKVVSECCGFHENTMLYFRSSNR